MKGGGETNQRKAQHNLSFSPLSTHPTPCVLRVPRGRRRLDTHSQHEPFGVFWLLGGKTFWCDFSNVFQGKVLTHLNRIELFHKKSTMHRVNKSCWMSPIYSHVSVRESLSCRLFLFWERILSLFTIKRTSLIILSIYNVVCLWFIETISLTATTIMKISWFFVLNQWCCFHHTTPVIILTCLSGYFKTQPALVDVLIPWTNEKIKNKNNFSKKIFFCFHFLLMCVFFIRTLFLFDDMDLYE